MKSSYYKQGVEINDYSVEFSPDGQRILIASPDDAARVFHLVTLSELAELLSK